MPGALKTSVKQENGAVVIIVALSMTVFIGLLALVVDMGYMYEMRRQLQSAADAGALAGMAEKIKDGSDAEVLAAAQEYALKNDLVGQPDKLELLTDEIEITDEYVKIGVGKKADLFFAAIFNRYEQDISAQAKAKRVYVTGIKGAVPWAVSTIRAARMEASVNGQTAELTKGADDDWDGNLSVPLAPRADGYSVDLTIYNSQDFPQTFAGVGSVVVHADDDPITDVYLGENVLSPGGSTYLYVATTGSTPRAEVGGVNYNEAAFSLVGANLFRARISAPSNGGSFQTFPVDIRIDNEWFRNVARLVVRQSTTPVGSIDFGALHFSTGGGTTPINVTMRDFTYGELYDLKVVSNPETGNFNALDFRYIYHPPDYTWNHGANHSGADYYDNLENSYAGEIHVGDIITTNPGVNQGQTIPNLNTRVGGCSLTFAQWEDAGKPGGCGRLLYVPVVERIEKVAGRSDVIVNALAVFWLENYAKSGNDANITGRFVEYARTGSYSDTPPDTGLYLETVRLDKPDY